MQWWWWGAFLKDLKGELVFERQVEDSQVMKFGTGIPDRGNSINKGTEIMMAGKLLVVKYQMVKYEEGVVWARSWMVMC